MSSYETTADLTANYETKTVIDATFAKKSDVMT